MKENNDIKTFPVVESFYSIQGEGFHTGKPAFFIRLGGCNVLCGWCDVKESWNPDVHEKFTINSIVNSVLEHPAKSVVITGGEPLMQNLDDLCNELKLNNIETHLETSGTHPFSGFWNWVCLSPKRHHPPREENFEKADELKVIIDKFLRFDWAESCKSKVSEKCRLYLQPEWSSFDKITPHIVEYIKNHPEWSISIQTHKYLQIP